MKPEIELRTENFRTADNFLYGTFTWMGIGLLLTALVAFGFEHVPALISLLIEGNSLTALGYFIMLSPLAFVLIMSMGYRQLRFVVLLLLYLLYAAMMGASLSLIFLAYTDGSVFSTFLFSAIMFGSMAFFEFVTNRDLTRLGNIMAMGLIGIIVASIGNLLIRSDSFSFGVNVVAIIVFCGLTASDVKKLKTLSETQAHNGEKSKLGILGALTLYLDFINLFLSMLRVGGGRRRSNW